MKIILVYLMFICSIYATETINVCYHTEWEPIEYQSSSGEVKGISIDILNEINKNNEFKYNFIHTKNLTETKEFIKIGKCDIIPAITEVSNERDYINYSIPYMKYSLIVVGNKNTDKKHLNEYVVNCIKGESLIQILNDKKIKIQEFNTFEDAIMSTSLNKNEILLITKPVYDIISTKYHINNLTHLYTSDINIDISIGVNNNNIILLYKISSSLKKINQLTIDNIVKQWTIPATIDIKYYQIFIIILILLVIILIISTYKNYMLIQENKILSDDTIIKNIEQTNMINIISTNINFSRTDINGIITEVSDRFIEQSGYSRNEVLGKTHSVIKSPRVNHKVFNELWSTIIDGNIWNGEIENITKDGKSFWSDSTIYSEYDYTGKKIGYIAIRHDITHQKELEVLEQQQSTLITHQAKLASMGEMLGNIAHQWRQPLSIISTSSSAMILKLEHNILTDKDIDIYCNNITNNCMYLSDTINTFRDFLNTGSTKINTSVNEIIEDTLKLIHLTYKEKSISLNNILEEDIILYTSKSDIEQVLINILNNAKDVFDIRRIKEPTVIINAYKTDTSVIITVEDNAGGIHMDIIGKIFEPYFTTKHKSQGTGLGLYMSHKLITDSLGGELIVNNTGNGAKFSIIIPIKE